MNRHEALLMSTKQQRKTAKRKAAQAARRERNRLISAALQVHGGPATREAAIRVSDARLREIVSRGVRRRMTMIDSPVIGMALAEAIMRGMEAERSPRIEIVIHEPLRREDGDA